MTPEKIFCKVLSLDLAAVVAVGLVLIARLCFRKAPRRCSYFLWSVVLLRLVIPFSVRLPGKSLLPVSADAFGSGLAAGETPVIDSGNRLVDSAVNNILPAAEVGASANPMRIWLSVGAAVWIAGMTALTALSLIKYFRLVLIADGAERDGNIAVSESFGTAFVLGLFRPVNCLPAGLPEGDRRMIFAHETAHIRRGDHVVKMVSYILLVIHWYDPVMWLAFGLMTRDMEMSCDEAVINGGFDRSEYAGALLRLSVGNEILPAIPPTFGEGAVKERIVNVMKFNVSNAFVSVVAVIAAAVIVTACAVTGGKDDIAAVDFAATETEPGFGVSMTLPDGWKIGGENETYFPGLTGDTVAIVDADGDKVGYIGSIFYPDYTKEEDAEGYPAPFSENYWQLVYPELRLPNHWSWDIDPSTSIRTEVGETMLATVYAQIPEDGKPAAAWEVSETRGVVSYNDTLHVYVFIDLYDVDDATLDLIAESLSFTK